MTGALNNKTVHVHLTRACNLECVHCYSLSGPTVSEALDVGPVALFLEDARAQGYEVVSFSGGEPFLHPGLFALAAHARALGLRATVVTNGTILAGRVNEEELRHFDLVAVSVDGKPQLHNEIRASASAFARMEKGLGLLRDVGVPFGVLHALTAYSLADLPWLADYAARAGARLFQIQPLGLVGAGADLTHWQLDGEVLSRAYLTALALRREYAGRMDVHIDLFNRDIVGATPEAITAKMTAGDRLADLVNPLVLMANGDVSPICHDMGERFRLGNINDGRLKDMAPDYLAFGHEVLVSFAAGLWAEVAPGLEWPYFNWYEMLETASHAEDVVRRQA